MVRMRWSGGAPTPRWRFDRELLARSNPPAQPCLPRHGRGCRMRRESIPGRRTIKDELLPPTLDEVPEIHSVGTDVRLYHPAFAALFDPVQVVLSGRGTGAAREHRRGWNAEHRNRSARATKLAEAEAMLMAV